MNPPALEILDSENPLHVMTTAQLLELRGEFRERQKDLALCIKAINEELGRKEREETLTQMMATP